MKKTKSSEWKVRSLDVWGNAEDGYDVNQEFSRGAVQIPDDARAADILKIFKKAELLAPGTTLKHVVFNTQSSEGFFAVEDSKTGEPIYHCYLEE